MSVLVAIKDLLFHSVPALSQPMTPHFLTLTAQLSTEISVLVVHKITILDKTVSALPLIPSAMAIILKTELALAVMSATS